MKIQRKIEKVSGSLRFPTDHSGQIELSRTGGFMCFLGIGLAMGLGAGTAQAASSRGLINWPGSTGDGQYSVSVEQAKSEIFAVPEVQELLSSPGNELIIAGKNLSPELETTRFQHFYQGLEVLGSQALHHVGAFGKRDVTAAIESFDLDPRPSLTAEQAVGISLAGAPHRPLLAEPELKVLPSLGSMPPQLIYIVKLAADGLQAGRTFFIQAHNGKIVADISHHMSIEFERENPPGLNLSQNLAPKPATQDIYAANRQCQTLESEADGLGGRAPVDLRLRACDLVIRNGEWVGSTGAAQGSFLGILQESSDDSMGKQPPSTSPPVSAGPEALQAFQNAKQVLSYYLSHHNRNSFDGKGKKVVSVVHIGERWVNAFWDSENEIMAYGDGDGTIFKPLTQAVDVAGHEMTHGVVSKTADLAYLDQSGALNEALADLFGKLIENQDDWVMGRALYVDPSAGQQGFRNIANPNAIQIEWPGSDGSVTRRPHPAHMSQIFDFKGESCGPMNDNCGVHLNSTIPSHAGYLVTRALGNQRAEKLLYATLTHYLTATSNFSDFKGGMVKACDQLFDQTSCSEVQKAFEQVGL